MLGVLVFLLIILMFQSFRLIDHILIHGAPLITTIQIVLYLSISFLPVILPISLLFAVLLTYGRLNSDSEMTALKSLGLNKRHLLFPVVTLGLLVCLLSAHTSFYLAPWGNRKMEVLLHKLNELKPNMTIKEGVFSKDFFNIIVYASKVDNKTGLMENVFIYDDRREGSPLTIIARKGKLITNPDSREMGNSAYLQLFEGSLHRASQKAYTKVDFQKNEIRLFSPISLTQKKKTPLSYTLNDLIEALKDRKLPAKQRKKLSIEFHRRWALSAVGLILALLGVGLSLTHHHKDSKSTGFALCLGVVVGYWILYASVENMAWSGVLPIAPAVWIPNILFAIGAWLSIHRLS